MPIVKKPTNKTKQSQRQPGAFTLELLTQAIVEQWPTDPTTPGVVCSFLPYESADSQFYVSIVRYNQQFEQGKRVVYSAKGSSFDDAARNVAEKLVAPTAMCVHQNGEWTMTTTPANAMLTLPKTAEYLKHKTTPLLLRLRHHVKSNRLVMMEPCNCLLGFEGRYEKEQKTDLGKTAEIELLNYPKPGRSETEVENGQRSELIIQIIDAIMAERSNRRAR